MTEKNTASIHRKWSWKNIPLLAKVATAIVLGLLLAMIMPESIARVFMTFNAIFSQFLGFIIPLIIVGLVAPAIADLKQGAGRLLLFTVIIAYFDTLVGGLVGYGTGVGILSHIMNSDTSALSAAANNPIQPYFVIQIPPIMDVMTALIFAFLLGLGGSKFSKDNALIGVMDSFKEIVERCIQAAIIPLLPLFIFGIFLNMGMAGGASSAMLNFAIVFGVVLTCTILLLIVQFTIAGLIAKRNPFRLLLNMLPAYLTALGTSSSAATIPVTLKQVLKNGVRENIANAVVPLCATIHLCGSALKITACAVAIMLMNNMAFDFPMMMGFILMLGVIMIAAPGVPGGSIMAALGILQSMLGFNTELQGMMIALYIAMDSFGTACNVTGDGAIAVIMNKLIASETAEEINE